MMIINYRKVISVFLIILLAFFSLLTLPVLAQENDQLEAGKAEFVKAPLNPDYLDYIRSSDSSLVKKIIEGDYPLGYVLPLIERHRGVTPLVLRHVGQPPYFDLRETGRITSVRDQGTFGSC